MAEECPLRGSRLNPWSPVVALFGEVMGPIGGWSLARRGTSLGLNFEDLEFLRTYVPLPILSRFLICRWKCDQLAPPPPPPPLLGR